MIDDVNVLPLCEKDRRITQSELEHVRDVFEGEIAGLKEELRASVSDTSPTA